MATRIYNMIMSKAEAGETCAGPKLAHEVWDPTPWIIDVYTGSLSDLDNCQMEEMRDWCNEHIGAESWPIHGRPGAWNLGGVTINGWTWIGFDTEEHMKAFMAAWPDNVKDQCTQSIRPME